MSKIRVEKEHRLARDQVRNALAPLKEFINKYHMKETWSGDICKLDGPGASGEIRIEEQKVVVEIKLGMLAKAAGVKPERVEQSVSKRLDEALG